MSDRTTRDAFAAASFGLLLALLGAAGAKVQTAVTRT